MKIIFKQKTVIFQDGLIKINYLLIFSLQGKKLEISHWIPTAEGILYLCFLFEYASYGMKRLVF